MLILRCVTLNRWFAKTWRSIRSSSYLSVGEQGFDVLHRQAWIGPVKPDWGIIICCRILRERLGVLRHRDWRVIARRIYKERRKSVQFSL